MIAESDRYHGFVLRQILIAKGGTVRMSVVDLAGRVDAFAMDDAAFQIKHSAKRLSPWQFTYMAENLKELAELRKRFGCVWVFLVCGNDGVVGLSLDELVDIVQLSEGGAAWVRVSRSRNAMYRVSGTLGELNRAKPRGVQGFLEEAFSARGDAQVD